MKIYGLKPALFVCCVITSSTLIAAEASWPGWRGPNRDAKSAEMGLLSEWTEEGPALLWKTEGLGRGYASVAIVGNRIYTMGARKGGCYLIALDLKDQSEIWATKVGGGNPNCTPTVDGDLIFALSRNGELLCAKTEDGSIVWEKNYAKDFGGKMMSGWGYSESPLIDGDRLICTPGAEDAMLTALDKKTGDVIWNSAMPDDPGSRGRDGAAYASPIISNGAGVKQYIQLVGRGVIGVRAEDGKTLWNYNRVANGTANIPTPIAKGDHIFCSTGYGTGAALLKLVKSGDGVESEEVYFVPGSKIQNHHGGMILLGNHIYMGNKHNNGFPLCIEMLSGEVAWEPGRGPGGGSAAIVYADGHLYFRYEDGTMALIEASPEEYRLKGHFKLAEVRGKSWPHPVIVGGKLYLRDQDVLMCYDVSH
ncbi:MAG: PQQ-binding-like beta-propeller repeat protein [Pirellulales bacterium]